MSIDNSYDFELDDEEFDPDPFGFDRPPISARGSAKNKPHGDSDSGKSEEGDRAGRDHKEANSRGDSEVEKNSCFSVPKPWPDTQRAAPSEFVRCSLFRPMRRRGKEDLARRPLDTNANVALEVAGPEIAEFDFDIWLTVVHLLRRGPTELTRWTLLATSPRARGAKGSKALRSSLERLQKTELVLDVRNRPSRQDREKEPDHYRFKGHLIDQVEWEERSHSQRRKHRNECIQITLNPTLSVLFEPWRRTIMFPAHREAIGDNPVSLWLYGMIQSHREVRPRPIEYYRRMSGSGSSRPDFERQVKRALALLADKHIIFSAELRRGILFVQRRRPAMPRKIPADDTEWHVLAPRKESA